MKNSLEKFGSFGAIFAAMVCPVCFPKLALLGALIGMGTLTAYETAFFIGVQVFVVLALAGHVVSYRKHQNWKLLSLVSSSVILLFISLYVYVSELLSYLSFGGLIAATLWLMVENRRCINCLTAPEEENLT